MRRIPFIRLYACTCLALAGVVATASPARAQFVSRSVGGSTIGEKYHIEASSGGWFPTTEMSISSESLGIQGDDIDFKKDLGLQDSHFREVHAVLRPAKKHKFRYEFIPIKFQQSAVLTRQIKFNGQLYTIGRQVNSAIDWRAHRFGYEYDFISRERGYGGIILEAKYTDVLASLDSPGFARESAHARAPIPAIGGVFRVYVVPNVSITGEVTGIDLPKNGLVENTTGHYADVDFYATYNVTRYFGAQIGYRSFDLGYAVSKDTGDFQLKGFYLGAVLRY